MFHQIESFIDSLPINSISLERKKVLAPLVEYVKQSKKENKEIIINFICTHNSRRSHLSQVWAQTLSHYYGIEKVICYSAGTEATAIFPMIIETLTDTGFQCEKLSETNNPLFSIRFGENHPPIIGFSKTINHNFNPKNKFAAVMTCSQADEGCPFVLGAEIRIPITFDDPKMFDNSPQQKEKYLERSTQIATELKYVFSQIQ